MFIGLLRGKYMNTVYKVIWDGARQVYVVVSELASNKRKKCSRSALNHEVTPSSLIKISLVAVSLFSLSFSGALYAEGKGSPNKTKLRSPVSNKVSQTESAYGTNSKVTHDWGTAIGANAEAGDAASSLGHRAEASGEDSIAIGFYSKAKNYRSIAIGGSSESTNDKSIAIGNFANSSGSESTALGASAVSSGKSALSVGASAKSAAADATAVGAFSKAMNAASAAFGKEASALQLNSLALGTYSRADAEGSISIGKSATSTVKDGIAIGTDSVANTQAGKTPYVISKATEEDKKRVLATTGTGGGISFGRNEAAAGGKTIYRQLTNVAAGFYDTDAVNVSQLKAVESLISKDGNYETLLVGSKEGSHLFTDGKKGLSLTAENGDKLDLTASGIVAHDAKGNPIEARLVTMGADAGETKTGAKFAIRGGKDARFADSQAGFSGENLATFIDPDGNVSVGIASAPRFDKISVEQGGVISADSTEAVNGSQLYATNTALENLNTSVGGLQNDALLWDTGKGAFSASHGDKTVNKITNVAAGDLSKDSTDAV
ncbi:hypothetical protein T029_25340, partial [Salmonella enterica subsp. enterica serovar Give]|nr:hypothetical protein [Salmonella enterica subsp. enterica serovar Give]